MAAAVEAAAAAAVVDIVAAAAVVVEGVTDRSGEEEVEVAGDIGAVVEVEAVDIGTNPIDREEEGVVVVVAVVAAAIDSDTNSSWIRIRCCCDKLLPLSVE